MPTRFNTSLVRAVSALAITFALAAPAAADHWQGRHGMPYGHLDCQGYHPGMHGPGDCPQMKGDARHAPMGGKTLGVMISDLPNAALDEAGLGYAVSVARVQPDSAAAAAGIQAGDLITDFAGSPVYSTHRLRWLVRQAEPDKSLEIKLMRDKQPVTVNATLQAPPPKPKCDDRPNPRLGT